MGKGCMYDVCRRPHYAMYLLIAFEYKDFIAIGDFARDAYIDIQVHDPGLHRPYGLVSRAWCISESPQK